MNRRYLPLVAVLLAVAGCDFKETRSGLITLTGSNGIPLNGRNGSSELVAGKADITFKKGSSDNAISIRVRQPNRSEIELEAKVSGDYRTGNFTLKGSEIGQPVDMASARSYAITGPTQSYANWEDQGNQTCMIQVSYDPCDENWTVGFRSASGAELGAFTSRYAMHCNERRSTSFCRHNPREPNFPRDFPRGGRNMNFDASSVKFD